jgi:membrane-anchored protein YejM (alkaline phosphatase superfamily)
MPRSRITLRNYYLVAYLATCLAIALFWPLVGVSSVPAGLFLVIATAAYAALYLAPVVVMVTLADRLLLWLNASPRIHRALTYLLALLGISLVLLAIYADYRLFELYQYHFNGFVWNLLTTPGGIAALGATAATERTVAVQVSLLLLATTASLWLMHRLAAAGRTVPRRLAAQLMAGLVLLLVVEEVVYAHSTYTGREDLLEAADVIPFHLRSGAGKLFKRLGVERTSMTQLRLAGGTVDYPQAKLAAASPKKMNVIMLVGESFRWDLLSPEITPNLWNFSNRAQRFEQHYSGGNRTRMGLFSMFYGLYAPYWYSFERQRVAPVLMDFLRQQDYQIAAHTSQSFNYPELRHTVFAGVPESQLQELQTGQPWRRDTQNISDLIGKIDGRDTSRPFFGFMLFESTHAPYDFPEDQELVRRDYLQELNYVKLDLADNIDGIHARYINAAHHIDREFGRLLAHLETEKLLDNTVILFTGDHGEEFMEKGRWGHGHGNTFPEEQIRVPLVLWVPGQAAEVVAHRTSHLQIAPTLLAHLGVNTPSRSYSSADSLAVEMPYHVVGEYDYMGIVDAQNKITFPFTGSTYFRYGTFDANDHPLTRDAGRQLVAAQQARLDEVVAESGRFLRAPTAN